MPSDPEGEKLLSTILDGDQWEAQESDWTRQAHALAGAVAAYYTRLTDDGVPQKTARKLTLDFQNDLIGVRMFQGSSSLFGEGADEDDDG